MSAVLACAAPGCGRELRRRPDGTWERRRSGLCDRCHCQARRSRRTPASAGGLAALAAAVGQRAAARRDRVARAARMAADGTSTAGIAAELGVRPQTVAAYLVEVRRQAPGAVPPPDVTQVNGRRADKHERRLLAAAVLAERRSAAGVLAGVRRAA